MRDNPEQLIYAADMAKHTLNLPEMLRGGVMWYVIQTVTGQEEILTDMIRKIIPGKYYRECFYIRRECADREGDGWRVYQSVLFPGYVFVDTDMPEKVYYSLKGVPKLTKLLKSAEEAAREELFFLRVSDEEKEFLENIQSEGHLVRRSLVKLDEEKQIIGAEGAVGKYIDCIVKQRVRKRFVLIRQRLLGKERKILLGIRLEEDCESLQ